MNSAKLKLGIQQRCVFKHKNYIFPGENFSWKQIHGQMMDNFICPKQNSGVRKFILSKND